jgi:hypothetical protein
MVGSGKPNYWKLEKLAKNQWSVKGSFIKSIDFL